MITEPEVAEVAYWLKRGARGRGVASRVLRRLAAWAFQELGIARLWLEADPGNTASQRVAEKAGFVREGLLRSHCVRDGARHDCVLFSLLPLDPVHGS